MLCWTDTGFQGRNSEAILNKKGGMSPAGLEVWGDALPVEDPSHSRDCFLLAVFSALFGSAPHQTRPSQQLMSNRGADLYVLDVWVTCLCDSRACMTHG